MEVTNLLLVKWSICSSWRIIKIQESDTDDKKDVPCNQRLYIFFS
jgi:hypothetical protein